MVRAVPGVPGCGSSACSTSCSRCSSATCRYARFLLDGQTAVLDDYLEVRPEAAETLRRLAASGPPLGRAVDDPHGRVHGLGRDHRPRPAARHARARRSSAARCRSATCPTCSGTSRRCPRCCAWPGSSTRSCGAACRRRSPRPRSGGRRPTARGARRVPLRLVLERPRPARRRQAARRARSRATSSSSATARLPGGGLLLMNGTDHQLPQPWLGRVVAEANDGAGRLPLRRSPRSPSTSPSSRPTGLHDLERRAAVGRAGQRAHGRGVEPRRRAPGVRGAPSARSSAGPSRSRALLLPADRYPHALLEHRVAQPRAQQRARLVVRVQRRRGRRRRCVVRYQEARQIGDGLAREALHALAAEVDAPPASTIVVNPTGRRPRRADRGHRARRRAGALRRARRRHAVPDAGAADASAARGSRTIVVGQKVRWVLEMMRGPEFAGARIGRYDLDRRRRRRARRRASTASRRASPPSTSRSCARSCSRSATKARRSASGCSHAAGARGRSSPPTPSRASGWRTLRAPPPATGPATAVTAGAGVARQRAPAGRGRSRPTARTRSRPPTGVTLPGLGRLVDGGDGGDTYNYSPPARTRRRPARAGRRHAARVRAGAGPVRRRRRPTGGRRTRSATSGRAARSGGRDRARHRAAPRSSCAPASGSSGSAPSSTTGAATTACGPTSRCRRRSPAPTPSARSRSCDRGLTAEGGPHEFGLPTFVSRRFVDASDGDVGLARAPRRPARVRVVDERPRARAHAAAGHRLPVSRASCRCRAEPGRAARPARRARSCRAISRSTTRVLPHRGDWRGAGLYDAADEFLVPLERVRGGGWPARDARRPAGALRVDGAEVSAVMREPGGLVVRVFNPSPETERRAAVERDGAPATGWTSWTSRAGRRSRSRARSTCDRGRSPRSAWCRRARLTVTAAARRARASAGAPRAGPHPAARSVDQAGSSPGRGSAVAPVADSQSSAGRAPCQRTAYDTAPGAGRRVVHLERSGRASRPGARRAAPTAPSSRRHEQRRAPLQQVRRAVGPGEGGRRRAFGRERSARARGRRRAVPPAAARPSRGDATPLPPRRSKPQSSSAATSPPSRRAVHRRSSSSDARAASTACLRAAASGSTTRIPRSSCAAHPAAASPASGSRARSTASTGADRS